MPVQTDSEWDSFLSQHPEAHILQTSAWGKLKSAFGWQVAHIHQDNCGMQVLFRKLPLGLSLAYIPKGPIGVHWENLLPEIYQLCLRKRSVFLKIEPDLTEPIRDPILKNVLDTFGKPTPPIQPRQTILIDLAKNEQEILGGMKQKTRYNIHLAERKGITVHPSTDIATFYKLICLTGQRDGFAVHSQAYYQLAYQLFTPKDECVLLQADYNGQPLAALMVFAHGKRAWYFYGASNDQERQRMPTYLLQWEGMRWAANRGCQEYDLWGIPDASITDLESEFTERSSGLWGVYRFKRGFGGQVSRSVGAWDRVYSPALYRLYQMWTKRAKIEN